MTWRADELALWQCYEPGTERTCNLGPRYRSLRSPRLCHQRRWWMTFALSCDAWRRGASCTFVYFLDRFDLRSNKVFNQLSLPGTSSLAVIKVTNIVAQYNIHVFETKQLGMNKTIQMPDLKACIPSTP